jgi:indole-3-glycerol phosphate synthase
VQSLGAFARSLGLEILLEVHDREELERTLCEQVDLIGVNNRNLKDFTLNVDTSRELAALIPDTFIKVSESGISKPETIRDLMTYGYKGFLMGEAFMKTSRPEKACAAFIQELKQTATV